MLPAFLPSTPLIATRAPPCIPRQLPSPSLSRRPVRLTNAPRTLRMCDAHSSQPPLASEPVTVSFPSASQVTSVPKHDAQPPDSIVDQAVQLAAQWAVPPTGFASRLAADHQAVAFFMNFVDRVMRPHHPPTAARLLRSLHDSHPSPAILSSVDRALLSVAAWFGVYLPRIVIPAARLRMLSFVSAFVSTLHNLRFDGTVSRNVNLLGEAVLGEKEASRRLHHAIRLLRTPGVEYVSVKLSGIVSQLNPWDFEGSLRRVQVALRSLFREAAASRPRVLINLDMEEYRDLELTLAAFTTILSEPEFANLDAGIVLQTYLPDALPALQKLVSWAHSRPGTGEIKIRLVKGANFAMEKVDAVLHGWNQAPYLTKEHTDANYLRCLSWALTPSRTARVRIGVATHNLFLLAYAHILANKRGVADRVGFEMLQGMTPAHVPLLSKQGHGMLLYTPVCAIDDFDVAVSYLFRRFEETTADGNFLRSLASMTPGSSEFLEEEARFRASAANLDSATVGPRRIQSRPAPACELTGQLRDASRQAFDNEPDTDPALPGNREWAAAVLDPTLFRTASASSRVDSVQAVDVIVDTAKSSGREWAEGRGTDKRKATFFAIADELARRRGALINAMVFEGNKTIAEADAEVSEAVDFATYYGIMGRRLPKTFEGLGVVCVVSPWNFPVAIPCGGVLAALAAGNAVILKPSRNTPRCAEIVAECAWAAGVPRNVLHFVQCAGNDASKKLITSVDGVILTGSSQTAKLFRSWKRDIRLFAETSGKNALIISPAADLDLAVADLVHSAFSNSGQRCSAASLAICIGDVYTSSRFRRQLEDAVTSLHVGPGSEISTVMGPLIKAPDPKLLRALTKLDEGESWLVKPRCLDASAAGQLWTPGVKLGVKPRSWFHQTEAFGPVLGIMYAESLDEAIALQNGTKYGLTGGIHSLDPAEIAHWTEGVEVGNAYINRPITGAIVQRQSFGGWKASVVGPGAKAGGPNYLIQLGTAREASDALHDASWLAEAIEADELAWDSHFSQEHDLSGLYCESNIFRYRPVPRLAVRVSNGANKFEVLRVQAAVRRCGVPYVVWSDEEPSTSFAKRLADLDVLRIRVLGQVEPELLAAASDANVHICDGPVVGDGRVELLHYLREQSISRTLHRFGNMTTG